MGMPATLVPPQHLARTFRALTDQWQTDTQHLSSPTAIALHPAYQRIIGLGPQVLPLIFAELPQRPAQWFWALRALTGVDPVPTDVVGDPHAMARAWLSWGQAEGWCPGMRFKSVDRVLFRSSVGAPFVCARTSGRTAPDGLSL
jgi:hypothetical protein